MTDIEEPFGIVVGDGGDVFFSEDKGSRVRRIDGTTNIVSTLLGNGTAACTITNGAVGTTVSIDSPVGLAVDSAGDVYVAGGDCFQIYKIDVSAGTVSIVAGTGTVGSGSGAYSGDGGQATAAEFGTVTDLAFDLDGNLLVTDRTNHRVRKIDMTSGIVTTIVGTGTATFSGDGGQATAAGVNNPGGIAVDNAGNVLFTDIANFRIRRVDVATLVISTIAGTGLPGFSGDGGAATSATILFPSGLSIDASGDIFFADRFNNRVRKIDGAGGTADTTAPELSGVPADVTVEATGAAGAVVSFTDPTAVDLVDGPVGVVCAPLSGSTFGLGDTTVTCSAAAAAGNTAEATFKVTVKDTTDPVLSGVPADVTVEATGAAGAVVSFTDPTAVDLVDGPVGVVCAPLSGATFGLGDTTVTCSATDASANTGEATFEVTVEDTTGPVITAPDVSVEATDPDGVVVTFAPTAVDAVDGSVPVVCDPVSGSLFPIGTTTVNCSAADNRNSRANTEVASFEVEVFVLCDGQVATHVGTDGADVMVGTAGADVMVGFDGDDDINGGRGGDDVICAGRGDDVVNGRGGADRLFGERGNDVVRGGGR